jgi:adenosylcobinamide-phosphate synthase
MLDSSPLAGSAGGTPLVVLLAVLILDLVLGFVPQMGQLHPPLPGIRLFFLGLERRLNRERRSEANRIIRGAVVALATLVLAVGAGWGLWRLAITLPFGIAAEVVVLFLALSQSRVIGAMGEVSDGLQDQDPAAAHGALAAIGAGDHDDLDAFGLARIAVEEGAWGFLKHMTAPVFWYCLAGLPGVFLYGASLTMETAFTSLGPRAEAFGLAARRFHDAIDYLPARLAGVILILGGLFLPSAAPAMGVAVLRRHANRVPGPNGGWLLAPMAGVLGLALCGPGGPGSAGQSEGGWIGDGRARVNPVDIRRAVYLLTVAGLILAALVAALLLVTLAP